MGVKEAMGVASGAQEWRVGVCGGAKAACFVAGIHSKVSCHYELSA
jgi:hypothetical protein